LTSGLPRGVACRRYKRTRTPELGAEDLYGDFELLLGSALLGLKVTNLPVRYRARRYGDTNIQRFSGGAMLAKLVVAGFRRIWVRPLSKSGREPG
jgi:hypothetical protein